VGPWARDFERGVYIYRRPAVCAKGGGHCFTAMFHVLSHNVHYAFAGCNEINDLAVEQYIIIIMSPLRHRC
jgi:hypothetical protein